MNTVIKEVIDRFCEIGARPPASEEEKAAAEYLGERFKKKGCEVKYKRFFVRPAVYFIFALHFFLFLTAMWLSLHRPGDGLIVGLVVIVSYWGDLMARHHYIRSLFPRKPSLNLVARKNRRNPKKRIILTAHIDSGRSGSIYRPAFANEAARFFKYRLKSICAPYYYLFLLMVTAEIVMLLRWLLPFGFLQGIYTLLLIVCAFALVFAIAALMEIGIAGSPVVGANGNASGVAAMTAVFESLIRKPVKDCEVWAVGTGSKTSGMTGMKEFAQSYFDDLDPTTTYFINFDHVGTGILNYVIGEGWVTVVPYPYEMTMMAEEIRRSDERFAAVKPYTIRSGTDGIVPARAGYKTITLSCLNENDYSPNYLWKGDTRENVNEQTIEQVVEFAKLLIKRISEV